MRESTSVIVLDREDSRTLESVKEALAEVQSEVIACASEEELLNTVESSTVGVLVINLEKPFERSFRLLSKIGMKAQEAEVIFVAPFDDDTLWAWVEVIRRGAYEFLPKPFDAEELRHHLIQAAKKHRSLSLPKLPRGFAVDPTSAQLQKTARTGT